uniref:Probable E3 ubiquitin-protein ligase TRIML1 n=1 Tax=Monodelphis domestica TaxID=13616 RepID=F6UHI9_MONDO
MDPVTLVQSLQQETTCGICLTFFTKPVTLNCGHNFCQFCLSRSREAGVTHFSCPECREVCQSFPGLNVRLSKLAAICKKLSAQNLQNPVGQRCCQEHQQVPKVFCKEDQTTLCLTCTEAQEHETHTLSPIDEAAQNFREKLLDTMPSLRKKIKELKELNVSKKDREVKWRKLIRGEYARMHQFLKEEEHRCLDVVTNDEAMTNQLMDSYYNELHQHFKNMEDTVREMEETKRRPDLELLQEGKELLQTCESMLSERPKSFIPELREYPVVGMKDMLKKFRVNVTMDPTTVNPYFVLSENLKSVKLKNNSLDQPDCAGKVQHFILGQPAFSSGAYYWEVDVSEQPQWALGISVKCLKKRKTIQYTAGYLYMLRCEKRGNEFYLVTRPGLVCQLMKVPVPVVGIYLDCNDRTLLFYNATKASLIYEMHIMPFKEPVRPLFCPCPPMLGTKIGSMTICPVKCNICGNACL